MSQHQEIFERERKRLFAIAYRMLSSIADAEDVLQEGWLRWERANLIEIENPQAFLTTIISRLCVDHLRSAQKKREAYFGTWLPEPLVGDEIANDNVSPDSALELADDLSFALFLTLEKLNPTERAAFLMHDVFDLSFDEISLNLDKSSAACRQLASRARSKVRTEQENHLPAKKIDDPLVQKFFRTVQTGDVLDFVNQLAADAKLVTDGGGKKSAARNPIIGRVKIIKFFVGLMKKEGLPSPDDLKLTLINGHPGLIVREADGSVQTWFISWTEEGQISEIYIVRNPDKLGHVNF